MKCKTVKNLISAFQDGGLKPDQTSDIKMHIKTCQACRKVLQEIDQVWDLLGLLPEPESQPFFYTRLKARMNLEVEIHSFRWYRRAIFPVLTTAMLALGIFLGRLAGNASLNPNISDDALFSELPMEDLNIFSEDSSITGYFELFGYNGGNAK